MNLHLFEGEGSEGADEKNGGTGGSGQKGNAGYTYEQAEEIANSRAEKASRAALANFYRKQGLSEEEVTAAINDFKAKQKENQPDVSAVEAERDEYKAQLEQMKNEKLLTAKGVRAEDLDYVMFKIGKLVDDKTDFSKATDKFLKENPRYAGTGAAYRVVPTASETSDGAGASAGGLNGSINSAIRAAIRR
ncbi:MAG: hypothetical protein IJ468_14895 [Lachnospiraceae bacterium]|nr:hypothetical protein [Lachnospiraceae bacterium]